MGSITFKAVEVVVFRIQGSAEFLVLQRSDDEKVYPGLWQIVSGGIDAGERAHEAAVREVNEEIGLFPQKLYNTPLTNMFYVPANDAVNLSPVFAVRIDASDRVSLSAEHKGFRWLEREKAVSLLVWPGQKEAIQSVYEYIILDNPSRDFMEIPIGHLGRRRARRDPDEL
jgi:dATP pyrophosphohydrolase